MIWKFLLKPGRLTIQLSITFLVTYPREMKTYFQAETFAQIFIVALLIRAKFRHYANFLPWMNGYK